jgi:hypothetical protein
MEQIPQFNIKESFSGSLREAVLKGVTRGVALEHYEYIKQSATRKKFCPLKKSVLLCSDIWDPFQ